MNPVIYGQIIPNDELARQQSEMLCPYCRKPLGYGVEVACVQVSEEDWDISHETCYKTFAIDK